MGSKIELLCRNLSLVPNWHGKPYAMVSCPLASWRHPKGYDEHPSMGIHREGYFHCFSCGARGKLWLLAEMYAKYSGKQLDELIEKLLEPSELVSKYDGLDLDQWLRVHTLAPFPEAKLRDFGALNDEGLAYLASRGISKKVAFKFGLMQTSKRIVFPITMKHTLVGAIGRLLPGREGPKYYVYSGFPVGRIVGGLDQLQGHSKILIVEGFFDLLHCWEWAQEQNRDMLCTFGVSVTPEQVDILSGLDASFEIGYDGDFAGEEGWKKFLKRKEGFYGLKRLRVGKVDLGAMTKEEFLELLH